MLIDCGPDARMQLLRAGVERLDALLITHEHNDHIIGLDDLRPLIFKQRAPIVIYAEERVQASIRERFAYAFAANPYPGAPRFELRELTDGQVLTFAGLPRIEALRVMHGSLPILGFRIGDSAYLTDVKSLPPSTLQRLHGLANLITSSLHESPHHSHMNLEESITLADAVSAQATYFIHMSHRMGLHAAVSQVLPKGVHLAYDGLEVNLKAGI